MLVVQMHEVLNRIDIPQGNGFRPVEPLPVVQGVTVVAEDRRTREPPADVAQRHRKIPRQQAHRRLADLVDVRRREKAQPHIAQAQPRDRGGGIVRFRPGGNLEFPRALAKSGVLQQTRQVAANLVQNGQRTLVRKRLERVRFR